MNSAAVARARSAAVATAHPAGIWSGQGVVLGALALTGLGYAWFWQLQARGRSAPALEMPDMRMTDMGRYWAFPLLQSSGLVGLGCAYLAVLLGLVLSGNVIDSVRAKGNAIHRQLGLTVVGLVLVHAAATVWDAMGNTWPTVLIPGYVGTHGWPEATWGFTAGIVACYALLLVGPTYYLRHRFGRGRWRILHRFVLVSYALSVWHALVLGLDVSHYPWLRPAMWLAQVPLLALLAVRVRRPTTPRFAAWASNAMAALCCGGIAATVAIVVTGHAGFIHTV